MSYLFKAILNLIDFFYQKKIINFFKKNMDSNMQLLLDIGSHKGETIEIFLKNFNIKNIYSFEASASNYAKLKNNVMKILESNDIASFDSIGNIFDHNIHEAIAQKSSKEKKGIIIDEFEKGYTYHDRVIRHAKVIVSSGKE